MKPEQSSLAVGTGDSLCAVCRSVHLPGHIFHPSDVCICERAMLAAEIRARRQSLIVSVSAVAKEYSSLWTPPRPPYCDLNPC